jgi:hypothetical protein
MVLIIAKTFFIMKTFYAPATKILRDHETSPLDTLWGYSLPGKSRPGRRPDQMNGPFSCL